jgi:hypothetical protein
VKYITPNIEAGIHFTRLLARPQLEVGLFSSHEEGTMTSRQLWIAGGLVVFLLASSGACSSSDSIGVSETKASVEIDQLFENYIDAYNAYDLDAIRDLITDDYMIYETPWDLAAINNPVSSTYEAERFLEWVELYFPSIENRYERLGDPIMTGNDPWLVSQVISISSNDPAYPNGVKGISILTVVNEGGTLKVARDIFVGFEVK